MVANSRRRTACVAIVVPLVLVGLAGCGSNGPVATTTPTASASGTPSPTSDATSGSSATPTTGTTPSPGVTPTSTDSVLPASPGAVAGAATDVKTFLALVRTGMASFTTARVTTQMAVSGQRITTRGVVDLRKSHPAADFKMTMPGSGGQSRAILLGAVMYLKTDASPKWLKFDTRTTKSPLGALSGLFDNLDPAKALDAMAKALTSVKSLGTSAVDGQTTTHYRATVDGAKLSAVSGLPAGAASQASRSLAYDVWLDSGNRITRFKMGMGEQGTLTGSYSRLGMPVHITAPPASQLMSMSGASAG